MSFSGRIRRGSAGYWRDSNDWVERCVEHRNHRVGVITQELIVKEVFISALLPFLVKVVRGKGIDNLRHNINEAWTAYKRNRQKKGL